MKALVFDTETTDLISNSAIPLDKQPYVIEFFGHIVDDAGTIHEELEFMCSCPVPIPAIVTKITGLRDNDIAGFPPFKDHIKDIQAIFDKADAIVAHNLSFDLGMLQNDGKRNGYEFKFPAIKICTVEETEHIKGFRLDLTSLHLHLFDEGFLAAHRARNDVNALTRCYLELRKRGVV
jgi:DNA polymerase III alpha subunit (gram-positive type)